MPAEEGGDEVGSAEDVDAAAERGAGDAVESAAVPGYLRSVDSEMGGDLDSVLVLVGVR